MANLSNINNKFLVTTGGNVGIGTTSPNVLLDVWGATPTIRAVGTSASNPSLTLTSVGITAWSQTVSGSDSSLSFNKDGSEKMRIDTSGNVGIGTASPDSKLQIMNNDGSSYRFGYGGSSDVYLDADNVYIRTDNGGANTATFTTTGLGIGTTSPQSTLHVDGDIRRELDGTSTIGFGSGSTSAWYSGIKTVDFGAQNVGLTLFTTTNAGTTNVDALTIDEDGNVGIGTTSPTRLLQLNSSGQTDLHLTSTSQGVGASDGMTVFLDSSGTGGLWLREAQSLRFATNSSEKMTILSGGNVGIGTTSPSAKLEIYSTTLNNQLYLVSPNTGQAGINFGGTSAKTKGRISYSDNSDSFFFYTDSVERMRITSAGNVGIGNTNPLAKLQITSGDSGASSPWSNADELVLESSGNAGLAFQTPNTGAATIAFQDPESVQAGFIQYLHGDNAMRFATNGNNIRMLINSSGNVGIGVTPESWGTGGDTRAIQISTMTSLSEAFDGTQLASNFYFDGTNDKYIQSDFATSYLQIDGSHRWRYAASGTADANITWSEAMRIDSSGNVGIGLTSPAARLDVLQETRISYLQGNQYRTRITNTDGNTRILSDGQQCNIIFGTTGNVANGTASEAMRLNWEGKLGIGTTSPDVKLHVNGGTSNVPLLLESTDNKVYISFKDNDTTSTPLVGGDDNDLIFATSDTERMRITSGGDVLFGTTGTPNGTSVYGSAFTDETSNRMILRMASSTTGAVNLVQFYNGNGLVGKIQTNGSATSYITSSDYRLKEDLQDFNGLDKVSKIPVYDFKWKTDESRSYGVMAHELQEVLPQAVSGDKDAEEMQGVDYSKIVPLLVKSIQELKAEIDELKK